MAYILYVSLLATSIYLQLVRSATPNEFGPYEVEIDGFMLCPRAKQLSGTEFHPSISTEKDKPQRLQLNYTINREFFLESIQLKTTRYHESRKRLWNFSIKKPCKHSLFKKILTQQRVIQSIQECIVKKGTSFFDMDIEDIMRSLVGSSSVYGRFTITISFYSTKGIPQGPYQVEMDGFMLCPGTKLPSGIAFHPSISTEEDKTQRIQLNCTFTKEIFLESIQLKTSHYNDSRRRLWNFSIKKPCKDPLFKRILTQLRVLQSIQECILKKGNFFFDMDIDDIMRSLLGSVAVYGRYTITISFHLPKGTPVVCLLIDSFKIINIIKKVV